LSLMLARMITERKWTEGSRLLDIPQAAEYLNTTERHIQKLWWERKLSGIKLGRLVRFRMDDLDRFIAEHRVEATQ
jgi:excisionase family DNA binding protein